MRKIFFYLIILFTVFVLILYCIGRGNTIFYIVGDNASKHKIKVKILLDNRKILFNDTITTASFSYEKLQMNLSWGIHNIKVISDDNVELLNYSFFIYFKHYLVITHADYCNDNSKSCFFFDYRFSEFYLE